MKKQSVEIVKPESLKYKAMREILFWEDSDAPYIKIHSFLRAKKLKIRVLHKNL